MLELKYNILDAIGKYDAICITTNGCVNKFGEAVMGAGVAVAIANMYPGITKLLGSKIIQYGNIVNLITRINGTVIFSFPTKPGDGIVTDPNNVISSWKGLVVGNKIKGWMYKSDLNLISRSTKQLVATVNLDKTRYKTIMLPRPGCANGQLNWETQVRPVIEPLLDNRFTICYL